MHINVRDILAEDLGYHRTYAVTGERPELPEVRLTHDLEGEVVISRSEVGLLVKVTIKTEIELECHRCLRKFTRPIAISFTQTYREEPGDDDLPIEQEQIDLAPLIQQEILVSLPIKLLCRPDCPGVEGFATEYTNDETSTRLQDQARITKGSQRGRTQET
ncbi:MAG TPA: YceD family protein [Candidatus Saccharimonadia bacterium]|nr:YceD family protein [Candidatus Saccharimonadia bacterium]